MHIKLKVILNYYDLVTPIWTFGGIRIKTLCQNYAIKVLRLGSTGTLFYHDPTYWNIILNFRRKNKIKFDNIKKIYIQGIFKNKHNNIFLHIMFYAWFNFTISLIWYFSLQRGNNMWMFLIGGGGGEESVQSQILKTNQNISF